MKGGISIKKKTLAILSLVLSILSIFPFLFAGSSNILILSIIGLFFAIVGVILGFIAFKEAKGLSLAGIIIGIICIIILVLGISGLYLIQNLENCVDNNDGTATCTYSGVEVQVPIESLNENQMKEGN